MTERSEHPRTANGKGKACRDSGTRRIRGIARGNAMAWETETRAHSSVSVALSSCRCRGTFPLRARVPGVPASLRTPGYPPLAAAAADAWRILPA